MGPAGCGLASGAGLLLAVPQLSGARGCGRRGRSRRCCARLAREANALRVGPVYDGDPGLELLAGRGAAKGWAVLDRFVADSCAARYRGAAARRHLAAQLDARKNRFHEKHLGGHGELEWRSCRARTGARTAFDALAEIEEKSWIAARTDG